LASSERTRAEEQPARDQACHRHRSIHQQEGQHLPGRTHKDQANRLYVKRQADQQHKQRQQGGDSLRQYVAERRNHEPQDRCRYHPKQKIGLDGFTDPSQSLQHLSSIREFPSIFQPFRGADNAAMVEADLDVLPPAILLTVTDRVEMLSDVMH
jgi:hypothetical protein